MKKPLKMHWIIPALMYGIGCGAMWRMGFEGAVVGNVVALIYLHIVHQN